MDKNPLEKQNRKVINETEAKNVELNLRSNPNRLSRVIYATYDKNMVHVSLEPSYDLIKKEGITSFKKEVDNGLRKLAEIIKSNNRIQSIWMTSWIVTEHPLLIEKLGFIIIGKVQGMENKQMGYDEKGRKRPPGISAIMKREDFLSRYGSVGPRIGFRPYLMT